jgi:hypothetical protein
MGETSTPQTSAEQEAVKREMARKVEQFLREGVLLGLPMEALAQALTSNGEPALQMEERIRVLRESIQREAKVDPKLEVANTLKRLEILWAAMMSEGDHAGALRVVQERARFTRAADFVTHTTASDARRPKSQYELDREQIDPVELEELNVEYRKRMAALAEETRARRTSENEAPARIKNPGA